MSFRRRKLARTTIVSWKELSDDDNLENLIEEYEKEDYQIENVETLDDEDLHHEVKVSENQNFDFKKSITPICMFKDLMDLNKENIEKSNFIKNLEQVNLELKREYNECLKNNKKME